MAATQASFAGRRDASWDRPGPAVAYGTQPPSSPTLTNPDMILPDYDHGQSYDGLARASSSSVWSMANPAGRDFAALPPSAYHAMPLGPSTPIIYGNGTMLSDIGEVTEVESIASSPPRRMTSRPVAPVREGTPLRSSPTIGKVFISKRPLQERRMSLESTSTINESGRVTAISDFDDALSVVDSCFQGDDEESLASSYIEEIPIRQSVTAVRPVIQSITQSRATANSISKRAEHILANAKRRLSVRSGPAAEFRTPESLTWMQTMEGNLSKARSFGYSSASDGSTPSPNSRHVKSFDRDMLPESPSGRARVADDAPQEPSRPVERFQRSASALGTSGGYRQPALSPDTLDAPASHHSHLTNKLSQHPLDMALTPLSEGDRETDAQRASARVEVARAGSVASPTLSSFSDTSASRPASAAQVRDLQDQMEGLKGKISHLRKQARADSMRRRSLQGLRTPSPFTHARWDQKHVESRSVSNPDHRSRAPGSPLSGILSEGETAGRPSDLSGSPRLSVDEDAPSMTGSYHEARETQDQHYTDSVETVKTAAVQLAQSEHLNGAVRNGKSHNAHDGDVDGDGEVDGASESGDSLYHDTYQHPLSHEDREDAFDYEHFFLHSAMGTLSHRQRSRRGSSGSDESGDSDETTRGLISNHPRRPSLDTLTTVDSFTTAIEGRRSRNSLLMDEGFDDGFSAADHEAEDAESMGLSRDSSGSGDSFDSRQGTRPRQNSVIHRPTAKWTLHRPSTSSFESTGTNRSFPLVNRVRISGGIPTPVSSPGHDLKRMAESIMTESTSISDKGSIHEGHPASPAIQMLSKEDQMMVERVVASLGRCVLGLTEPSQPHPKSQEEFRRRIDAARKILEAGTGS